MDAGAAAPCGRGDRCDQLREYRCLIDEQAAALGADHPDTLTNQHRFALLLAECGQLEQARQLLQTLVAHLGAVLGPLDPESLATRLDLALITRSCGDRVAAAHLAASLRRDLERAPLTPSLSAIYSRLIAEFPAAHAAPRWWGLWRNGGVLHRRAEHHP